MKIAHKENAEHFDKIAEQYDRTDINPLLHRRYSKVPSVFRALGDLRREVRAGNFGSSGESAPCTVSGLSDEAY